MPFQKVFSSQTKLIQRLRQKNFGARRIQSELIRHHEFHLSLATIHKTLKRLNVGPLVRLKRKRSQFKRYSRPIPGDRVQMDTCKIGKGFYQYTAVDDCTRYKVVALFPKRTAANTLNFLEQVVEEMPFPVQRIQTDRGGEFFAYKVQERLMEWGIKFRPVRPGSPHLNEKVERAQKTDLDEFYTAVSLKASDLEDQLAQWQHYHNWQRPHGGLNGKAPIDRYFDVLPKTPFSEEVYSKYDPSKERFRSQNYQDDLRLQKLKRSP
jgi:transposase InsO family protein